MSNQHNKKDLRRRFQVTALAAALAIPATLQAQTVRISVADARFTAPLVEKWVSEYQKVQPAFQAEIVAKADGQTDTSVSLTANDRKDAASVGRFFVLPIANSQSPLLSNKKVRHGLDSKLTRQLFVAPTVEEAFADDAPKELPGTVYTLTGSRAVTTSLLASQLGVAPGDLRGKKILGKEENAIAVVKSHDDAITVGVASLAYDQQTRRALSGLTVLPVDLNGNGKITDEERAAFENLDALTAYLENVSATSVPTGAISIKASNSNVADFLKWVGTQGQDYLSQFGYLKANRPLTAQK